MPRLYQTQPCSLQLSLAVRVRYPAGMAQTFAAYVGQFYERAAFDALAREVHDLYAARSANDAALFRTRLDRRLYDRYHAPVAWQVADEAGEAGDEANEGDDAPALDRAS